MVNYLNMAKTCLKVLKGNCSRLRMSLSLQAFACLEVTAWSRWVSLAERSHSSFALYLFSVHVSSSLSFSDADDDCQWELQVSEN
jgi:hypothetical protein